MRNPEHPETTHTPQSKMTDKLFPIVSKPLNAKLTDGEERAKDKRIGTCG
jgi:hypothetical protein